MQSKPLGPPGLETGGPAKLAPAAPVSRPAEKGRPCTEQPLCRESNGLKAPPVADGCTTISPEQWGWAKVNSKLSSQSRSTYRGQAVLSTPMYQVANLRNKSRKWSLLYHPILQLKKPRFQTEMK